MSAEVLVQISSCIDMSGKLWNGKQKTCKHWRERARESERERERERRDAPLGDPFGTLSGVLAALFALPFSTAPLPLWLLTAVGGSGASNMPDVRGLGTDLLMTEHLASIICSC